MNKNLILNLVLPCVLIFNSHAQTTLISEDFTDGQTSSSSAMDATWYRASYQSSTPTDAVPTGTLSIESDAVLNQGNALIYRPSTGAGWGGVIGKLSTPVSLTSVGDSFTFKLNYRHFGVLDSTNGSFRIGLYNSNKTSMSSESNRSARSDDFGYNWVTNPTISGNQSAVYKESGGSQDLNFGTDGGGLTTGGVSSTSPSISQDNSTSYEFIWTMTRTGLSAIDHTITLNGNAVQIDPISAELNPYFTFDEIVIFDRLRGSSATTSEGFAIDSVSVTSSIPEPSTYCLLIGLFMLCFVWYNKNFQIK